MKTALAFPALATLLSLAACGGGAGPQEAPRRPRHPKTPCSAASCSADATTGYAALEEAPAPYRSTTLGGPIDRRTRPPQAPATRRRPAAHRHGAAPLGRAVCRAGHAGRARVLTDTPLLAPAAPDDPYYDQDDALFDIAPLPGGHTLVAGATGYQQNPVGLSISSQCAPLLAVLGPYGRMAERIALPAGEGQNPVLARAPTSTAGRCRCVPAARRGLRARGGAAVNARVQAGDSAMQTFRQLLIR